MDKTPQINAPFRNLQHKQNFSRAILRTEPNYTNPNRSAFVFQINNKILKGFWFDILTLYG